MALRPPTPSRPAQPPEAPVRYLLTRRRIVRAALEVIDRDGLAALSMRRLAGDLGVTPRALYRHVSDKDDLLQAVCEEALGETSAAAADDRHLAWQEQIRQVQRSLRRTLAAHPHLVPLLAQVPTAFPAALLRVAEAVATALQDSDAGATPEQALRLAYALYNYVLGFATIAALTQVEGEPQFRALAERVAAQAAPQAPTLDAAGPFLTMFVTELHAADEQFDLGLDLMLRGIERT
jgi:AcrR family transcriptional regulator